MTDSERWSLVLMGVALLLSLGNLLIAVAHSRVKQAEVDTQALQMAVSLAEKTPALETDLRQAVADLRAAQVETGECRSRLDELKQLISLQAEEIHRLKEENDALTAQLGDLLAIVQVLRAG